MESRENRFRSALDAIADPFALLSAVRDRNGSVVDFEVDQLNAAAAELLQVPAGTQIGVRIRAALEERQMFAAYRAVVEIGTPIVRNAFVVSVPGPDGHRVDKTLDMRVVKVGDGIAITGRDLTEWLRAEQVRLELALGVRDRSKAVRALARLRPLGTARETAQQVTDALLDLPGVDVAIVFAFEGDAGISLLVTSGPAGYPLQAEDALPPARAAYLRERAAAGPWVESWEGRIEDGPYAERITASGLRSVAFGPIGNANDPVGLLVIGAIATGGSTSLVAHLPDVVEFAASATVLLGQDLRLRRDLASVRTRLATVIAGHQFVPVFQPIVDIATGRPLGYEALTRFADGRPPDRVFAEATAAGIGHDLEAATLRTAIHASLDLPAGPWLSLNVGAAFVVADRSLPAILRARTRPVVLEITEHANVVDYSELRVAINALGPDIRTAVDDAGVGFANFAHIADLRPQFVKIDATLVRGVDGDVTRQALIAGLQHFARATDAWLIAEGVETDGERRALARLGVIFGQGYLFGMPAAASTFGSPADAADRDRTNEAHPTGADSGSGSTTRFASAR